MATKPYKPQEGEPQQVNEPVAAYQRLVSAPHLNAGELQSMTSLSADWLEGSFDERYQKARAFALAHFDKDYVASLEARNFMIDMPSPSHEFTEEEWEQEMERAEASGVASEEEVAKMFSIWENFK